MQVSITKLDTGSNAFKVNWLILFITKSSYDMPVYIGIDSFNFGPIILQKWSFKLNALLFSSTVKPWLFDLVGGFVASLMACQMPFRSFRELLAFKSFKRFSFFLISFCNFGS